MMNSKQAIKLLHNNQYQKHLGNGEYDYIHPLTDSEVKAIESLIERQERMIQAAIEYIQEENGDCPLNAGCNCIEDDNCPGPCPLDGSDEQAEKCWLRWLEGAQAAQDNILKKVFAPIKQCDCEGKKEKCDVLDLGIAPYDACEYHWLCEIAWQREGDKV